MTEIVQKSQRSSGALLQSSSALSQSSSQSPEKSEALVDQGKMPMLIPSLNLGHGQEPISLLPIVSSLLL